MYLLMYDHVLEWIMGSYYLLNGTCSLSAYQIISVPLKSTNSKFRYVSM